MPSIQSVTPATAELKPGQSVTFTVTPNPADGDRTETFTITVRDSAGRTSEPVEVPVVFKGGDLQLVVNQAPGSRATVRVGDKPLTFTVTNPA